MQSELELKRENSLEKKIEVFLASGKKEKRQLTMFTTFGSGAKERKELFYVAAITKTSRRIRNDFLRDRKSLLGRLQPSRTLSLKPLLQDFGL